MIIEFFDPVDPVADLYPPEPPFFEIVALFLAVMLALWWGYTH